jgi:hypothetical protein
MIDSEFGVAGHRPHRRTWDCQRCGAPYPCEPARAGLRECLGAIPLAMFTWAAFNAAVIDLGDSAPPAEDLFDRFIRWTRTDPPGQRPTSGRDQWRGYGTVIAALRQP